MSLETQSFAVYLISGWNSGIPDRIHNVRNYFVGWPVTSTTSEQRYRPISTAEEILSIVCLLAKPIRPFRLSIQWLLKSMVFESSRVEGTTRWRHRYVAIFVSAVIMSYTCRWIESRRRAGTKTILVSPTAARVPIDCLILETKVSGVAEVIIDYHFPTESYTFKWQLTSHIPIVAVDDISNQSIVVLFEVISHVDMELPKVRNYWVNQNTWRTIDSRSIYVSNRLFTRTLRRRIRLAFEKSVNFKPSSTSWLSYVVVMTTEIINLSVECYFRPLCNALYLLNQLYSTTEKSKLALCIGDNNTLWLFPTYCEKFLLSSNCSPRKLGEMLYPCSFGSVFSTATSGSVSRDTELVEV